MKKIIIAPVSGYKGETAGLQFVDGKAETDSPWLSQWFKEKGYTVKDSDEAAPADSPGDGAAPTEPQPAADPAPKKPGTREKKTP